MDDTHGKKPLPSGGGPFIFSSRCIASKVGKKLGSRAVALLPVNGSSFVAGMFENLRGRNTLSILEADHRPIFLQRTVQVAAGFELIARFQDGFPESEDVVVGDRRKVSDPSCHYIRV